MSTEVIQPSRPARDGETLSEAPVDDEQIAYFRRVARSYGPGPEADMLWLCDAVVALRAEVAALGQEGERNRRIVELVNAPGSIVKPAQLTGGRVVVVDGRTGLDSCEHTALECFDVLFAEADGGPSPGRLYIGIATEDRAARASGEDASHD